MKFKNRKHTAKGKITLECNGEIVASRLYRCYSERAKHIESFGKIRLPYRYYYLIITPEID